MSHDLNDITGYGQVPSFDVAYIQRKLSLAGEMKSAIRKLLDEEEPFADDRNAYHTRVRVKRLNEARKAMEAYLNCQPQDVTFPTNEPPPPPHPISRGPNMGRSRSGRGDARRQ